MTADALRQACVSCGRGWQHCHGTVILHTDGDLECTTRDGECAAAVEVHEWVVPCEELAGGCGCVAGVSGT